MLLNVSSTSANHQEVKIALHSIWDRHTYRWPSRARDQLFLSDLKETRIFGTEFSKSVQISNFTKIGPIGAELFHAEGQTHSWTDGQSGG